MTQIRTITSDSSGAARTGRYATPSPTKLLLLALQHALPGRTVPTSLDRAEDRRRIIEIQEKEQDAGWSRLRDRHSNNALAARQLHIATARATGWVDNLLTASPDDHPAYGPVRLALISTITRRLIVDGFEIARASVDHCKRAVAEDYREQPT